MQHLREKENNEKMRKPFDIFWSLAFFSIPYLTVSNCIIFFISLVKIALYSLILDIFQSL